MDLSNNPIEDITPLLRWVEDREQARGAKLHLRGLPADFSEGSEGREVIELFRERGWEVEFDDLGKTKAGAP